MVAAGCGRLHFDPLGGSSGDGGGDGKQLDGVLPPNTNVAFVLSTPIQGYKLGGIAGADALCNQAAANAGLPGSYVAWLSDATTNAIDRILPSRGWVRRDGRAFVDTPDDLVAGKILYPLAVDELGNAVALQQSVATGTLANGTAAGADCTGYSTLSFIEEGGIGYGTSYWTAITGTSTDCGLNLRMYCFGIGQTTPVQPPPTTARRAFLSAAPWVPAGGITAADAVCQNDAMQAGLTGTFRALLGITGSTAISRFSLTGSVWTRVDGVALADTTTDFATGNTIAPINVTAAGAYVGPITANAWTGGVPDMVGTATTTCADWTSSAASANAHGGLWLSSGTGAFEQVVVVSCQDTSNRLYCLEP